MILLCIFFQAVSTQASSKGIALMGRELALQFPDAAIQILSEPRVIRGQAVENPVSAEFLGDDGRGSATFRLRTRGPSGQTIDSEVAVSFSAKTEVAYAARKVMPGESLAENVARLQTVDLALNPHRQWKGLFLGAKTPWGGLEARASLIEGQPILATSIQRAAAIKTGGSVKLKIISNELVVWSQATVQETGHLGDSIRVIAQSTKRHLTGKFVAPDIVEVRL